MKAAARRSPAFIRPASTAVERHQSAKMISAADLPMRIKQIHASMSAGQMPDSSMGEILDRFKATPELRFVLTKKEIPIYGDLFHIKTVKILQQAWINDDASKKEWMDVPLVDIMSHDRDLHQP